MLSFLKAQATSYLAFVRYFWGIGHGTFPGTNEIGYKITDFHTELFIASIVYVVLLLVIWRVETDYC